MSNAAAIASARWGSVWWRSAQGGVMLTALLLLLLLATAAIAASIGAAGIPLKRLPAAIGVWRDGNDASMLARDQLVGHADEA